MIKKLIKPIDKEFDYKKGDLSNIAEKDEDTWTKIYKDSVWYLRNWPLLF